MVPCIDGTISLRFHHFSPESKDLPLIALKQLVKILKLPLSFSEKKDIWNIILKIEKFENAIYTTFTKEKYT